MVIAVPTFWNTYNLYLPDFLTKPIPPETTNEELKLKLNEDGEHLKLNVWENFDTNEEVIRFS
jgi:hypothetical protein